MISYRPGVGNLQLTGWIRPAKENYPARELLADFVWNKISGVAVKVELQVKIEILINS